ncbi:MAG TPA: hypothetical protein VEL76_31885 [Gemmataceae bacterium]|nr:hypothetical protein [Gemmataceae bacterium]
MMSRNDDEHRAPSPEQLAAYADGELDYPELAPLKRRVEEWLATHSEAAAEVEGQRSLTRLWQATTPVEPAESVWATVLARLEQMPQPATRTRSWLGAWVAGILVACAAAVWLAVLFFQPRDREAVVDRKQPGKTNAAPKLAPQIEEPFEVALADEIEILSVRGADTGTLIVGEVPVRGALVLVAPGEVEVQRTDAELRVAGSPMIWTPLENERDDP